MHAMTDGPGVNKKDDYLYGRGTAWFAFAMTVALMLFDYILSRPPNSADGAHSEGHHQIAHCLAALSVCLQRQAPSP